MKKVCIPINLRIMKSCFENFRSVIQRNYFSPVITFQVAIGRIDHTCTTMTHLRGVFISSYGQFLRHVDRISQVTIITVVRKQTDSSVPHKNTAAAFQSMEKVSLQLRPTRPPSSDRCQNGAWGDGVARNASQQDKHSTLAIFAAITIVILRQYLLLLPIGSAQPAVIVRQYLPSLPWILREERERM